jgi:hypothetical protein
MFARDGRHYAILTRNLAELAIQTIDVLIAAGAARTSPLSAINRRHFHGATARVPPPTTPFGVRQPPLHGRDHRVLAAGRGPGRRQRHFAPAMGRPATEHLSPHALPADTPTCTPPMNPTRCNTSTALTPPHRGQETYDPGNVFTATPYEINRHPW